jgi:hypothetical protein
LSNAVTVTSVYNNLWISQITGAVPGQTYSVRVALKFTGFNTFGSYGSSCNVTIAQPTASLTDLTCSTMQYYAQETPAPVITANAVTGALVYRFKFVGANGTLYYYAQSTSLDMFTAVVPVGDYNVSVAVAMSANGETFDDYNYGSEGTPCTIKYSAPDNGSGSAMTTPNGTVMNDLTEAEDGTQTESSVEVTENESIQEDKLWTVSASTNPYDENFYLRLNNAQGLSSTDVVTVRILDMQGKLIEQRSVVAVSLEEERYGDGLASGMYLVNITDNKRQQTIRVVKR